MNTGYHDESQSFLVTVSDLMAGLIFIFVITLMLFVIRYTGAVERVQNAAETRARILELLQARLQEEGLDVEIDAHQGVLRLTDRQIGFELGVPEPRYEDRPDVLRVGVVLSHVLPCFVANTPTPCSSDVAEKIDTLLYAATIDAVLIEGHTDARRILGGLRFHSNLELSGARAASVLNLFVEAAPVLDSLFNSEAVRVLSISGYGERRLLRTDDPFADENRRIDIRFIMEPPPEAINAQTVPGAVVQSELRSR